MTGTFACAQGVKAAVIGVRLSDGAAYAIGGRIGSGLRGAGVAIFARLKSVVGLGGTRAANGSKSPTLYRTMPRSKLAVVKRG